jgi:cytoskeleton protein RodZ
MTVGQRISQARHERGLSIEDLARTTKLRMTQIRQIEADELVGIDAEVYVRARIRALAAEVGLDPVEIIKVYENQMGITNVEVSRSDLSVADHLNIFEHDKKKDALPPRRSYTLPLIITGVVLLIAAAWVSQSLFVSDGAGNAPLPSASASQEPTANPEPSETESSQVAPTNADPSIVSMRLTAIESSWVQVKASNGDVLLESTLRPGDSIPFADDSELAIRVGNAGGIELEVNGVDLGTLGLTGEVLDRVFGLGDPRALS